MGGVGKVGGVHAWFVCSVGWQVAGAGSPGEGRVVRAVSKARNAVHVWLHVGVGSIAQIRGDKVLLVVLQRQVSKCDVICVPVWVGLNIVCPCHSSVLQSAIGIGWLAAMCMHHACPPKPVGQGCSPLWRPDTFWYERTYLMRACSHAQSMKW